MASGYSEIDSNFTKNSVKIKELGEGTFGTVTLCDTPKGRFVSKETKISDKSIGYPPDFLTEIDFLTKFRCLPSVIRLSGLLFDIEERKGHILLEVMSANLSEWIKTVPFNDRIKVIPTLIREIGGTLAVIHLFGFLHNDMKTNNILVDTTSNPPRFKLADFGKGIRIKDEDRTPYGGIEKYRPPTQRNVFESEYWAFMVILCEVVLGMRFVEGDNFYLRNSTRQGFNFVNTIETRLKKEDFEKLPKIFWDFCNPIIYEKGARLAVTLRRIFGKNGSYTSSGSPKRIENENNSRTPKASPSSISYRSPTSPISFINPQFNSGKLQSSYAEPIFTSIMGSKENSSSINTTPIKTSEITVDFFEGVISRSIIDEIDREISRISVRSPQFELIKEEIKQYLIRFGLIDYLHRFSRLFNKFLMSINIEIDINNLRRYSEVALVIVLKSKYRKLRYFEHEKEFLLFQRAFLTKIGYQSIVI